VLVLVLCVSAIEDFDWTKNDHGSFYYGVFPTGMYSHMIYHHMIALRYVEAVIKGHAYWLQLSPLHAFPPLQQAFLGELVVLHIRQKVLGTSTGKA